MGIGKTDTRFVPVTVARALGLTGGELPAAEELLSRIGEARPLRSAGFANRPEGQGEVARPTRARRDSQQCASPGSTEWNLPHRVALSRSRKTGTLCTDAVLIRAPASRPGSLLERQDDASLRSCMSPQRSQ